MNVLLGAVQHQRRHRDRRQHGPHVDLGVHHHRAWRPCPGSPASRSSRPNQATSLRVGGGARRQRRGSAPRRPTAAGLHRAPRAPRASAASRSRAPTTSAAAPRRAPARGSARDAWRRTAPPSRRPRATRTRPRSASRRRPSPRPRRPSAPRASARPATGSDRPVPRRSNMISRENDARRSKYRATDGSSQ